MQLLSQEGNFHGMITLAISRYRVASARGHKGAVPLLLRDHNQAPTVVRSEPTITRVVSVAATRTEITGFLSFSYMRRPQVSRSMMILEG